MQMKIEFDAKENIWDIEKDGMSISVISWEATEKGPMTEITVYSDKKMVLIIELLDAKFREDFCRPKEFEKTKAIVHEIGKTIFEKLDPTPTSLNYRTQLSTMVWNWVHQMDLRGAHVYYGLGRHFGVVRTPFNNIKIENAIPGLVHKNPGTRMDADI